MSAVTNLIRPYRTTRDLDLLRFGDGSGSATLQALREICEANALTDAVLDDASEIELDRL